ncbi:energy-coupling factor transporter transmembrane component T [Luteococcus peritonei]|uniref:Energy-coupling factor transporter transmembrane component T family protein n=1 Tax=Luteococcus peritonei TaxID=88874 RepID=A0ABW4RWX3_9ACTN
MSRRRTALDALNPAARVLLAVVLSIPLIITLDWLSALVALVAELVVLALCRVDMVRFAKRLAPLLLVAPLGSVSMALYGEVGGRTWWHWGPATISDHSLWLALALFIRVFALAIPAMAMLADVDGTRMADGLAQVLHLPSRFVLGSLAGFRTLGLFTADWRTLGQARRARGLGDEGRMRRWALMAFSLLVLALRRGAKLATAMEAKGFGSPVARTWARESRVGRADALGLLVCLAIGALAFGAAWHWGTLWMVWS